MTVEEFKAKIAARKARRPGNETYAAHRLDGACHKMCKDVRDK